MKQSWPFEVQKFCQKQKQKQNEVVKNKKRFMHIKFDSIFCCCVFWMKKKRLCDLVESASRISGPQAKRRGQTEKGKMV